MSVHSCNVAIWAEGRWAFDGFVLPEPECSRGYKGSRWQLRFARFLCMPANLGHKTSVVPKGRGCPLQWLRVRCVSRSNRLRAGAICGQRSVDSHQFARHIRHGNSMRRCCHSKNTSCARGWLHEEFASMLALVILHSRAFRQKCCFRNQKKTKSPKCRYS